MKLARCIGCGCHDADACHDKVSDGPCHWLVVCRQKGLGVCSACPDAMKMWDKTDAEGVAKSIAAEGTLATQ